MKRNNIGLWLSVFAGVLFTLALVVALNPVSGGGVIHLNDSILGSDLNSTNSASDNFVATYDEATGGFTWETSLANVDGLSGLLADDQHVLDSEVISAIEAGTLSTVNIDGGTINGITDLAVVDGGTGAGSFTDHGVLLGSGTGAVSVTATGSSGEVLTSNGSGADPTFQTSSTVGLPEADMWRLTVSFGGTSDITSNWERADSYGAGLLGSGLSESSGIFSFPSTGFWLIIFQVWWDGSSGTDATLFGTIFTTTNNSDYNSASVTVGAVKATGDFTSGVTVFLFNVTDVTTHKFKFRISADAAVQTKGNTLEQNTGFAVMKLGET